MGLVVKSSIISYACHNYFIQHNHLNPSCRMTWRCMLRRCFSVICKTMALSKERSPHIKFITLSSTFSFICEADQSGWGFVFNLFSDCFVPKATFDTSVMKYTLKMVWSGVENMHAGPASKQQKRLCVWLCLLQGTLIMYPVGVQVNDTKCCVSNLMFQLHWFHSLQGLANTYSVDSYQWKGKKSWFRCFYTQENGTW